jgi:hypothetical protein
VWCLMQSGRVLRTESSMLFSDVQQWHAQESPEHNRLWYWLMLAGRVLRTQSNVFLY